MTNLLTIDEAAKYLNLSLPAIKYHIYEAKNLTPTKYFGRSPAFSQEELDRFLDERRKQGRPPKIEDK